MRRFKTIPLIGTNATCRPTEANASLSAATLKTLRRFAIERLDHLTDLDQAVGDGDIRVSLAPGAAAIESEFDSYDTSSAAAILRAISATVWASWSYER